MCYRSSCGLLLSLLLVIFMTATVFVPWTYQATVTSNGCQKIQLRSWLYEYCVNSDECKGVAKNLLNLCPAVVEGGAIGDWHQKDWHGSKEERDVYTNTLIMVAVSAFCAFVAAMHSFARCMCSSQDVRSVVHSVMTWVGTSVLTGALIYFGVKHPGFDKFAQFDSVRVLTVEYTYGPLGWFFGVATVLLFMINHCMARSKGRGDQALLDAQSRMYTAGAQHVAYGSMQPQTQQMQGGQPVRQASQAVAYAK